MFNKSYSIVIFLLMVAVQNVAAEEDGITLNGVYGQKAILTIDGESVVLEPGQKHNDVKLIEVHDSKVVIKQGKQKKTLQFKNNLTPGSLSAKQAFDPHNAKTHILSAKLIVQSNRSATFDVDYFYDGQHGEYVTLTAKTLFRGKVTNFWTHSYTRLNFGRNHAEITVNMNEKAPQSYFSDSVQFEIVWASETDSGSLDTKTIELIKEWKR